MLDFAPSGLSEYDRELLQNRFDIRSWFGYVTPLLKKNNLLILASEKLSNFLNNLCMKTLRLLVLLSL